MTARPGMANQALGFRGLGYLAFWHGEIARAGEFFRRAAGLSRQQGAAGSLLRNLALLAAAQQAADDRSGVRRTLAELDATAAGSRLAPGFLSLAVEPHAAEDDATRVRALLHAMQLVADPRNGGDSARVHYVTGTLELTEGNPRAALVALERAARHPFPVALAYRKAVAYERLGQLDSARAVLQRVVAAPAFGSEEQIAWTRSAIGLGEIEERLGRYEEAAASYRRFLEQWARADPGLPDVIRVRARLAALLSRRDR
jgi:tetratricopeptide (TPR) repeat protein